MKITVMADSHKDFFRLNAVAEANLDSDLFIHLGDGQFECSDVAAEHPDKKFVFVKGNDDFGEGKTERVITVGGHKAYICHGDLLNVHNGLQRLIDRAHLHECVIALYGHTHVFRTEFTDGVYIMNPGSISSPRGKNPPSYGIIDITGEGKIDMRIAELIFP
ncbi:phosphoesterase [Clostridia bacterium]|nr:phosphoesterase [Clostridia bacterium]